MATSPRSAIARFSLRAIFVILCIAITGCVGRGTVLVRETVKTTVADKDTGAPLSGVEVYLIATHYWDASWNESRKVAETGKNGIVDVHLEYVAEIHTGPGSSSGIQSGACALEFRKEGYDTERISSPFKNPPDPLLLTRGSTSD